MRRSYTAGDAVVGEPGVASIVEALELFAGSSAVVAVDVMVVGIVVAIAVVVGHVNYAFFLTCELRESAPLAV